MPDKDDAAYIRLHWEHSKKQLGDKTRTRTLRAQGLAVLADAVNQLYLEWQKVTSKRSFVPYPDFPAWIINHRLIRINEEGNVEGTQFSATEACESRRMTVLISYQLTIKGDWLVITDASSHNPSDPHELAAA